MSKAAKKKAYDVTTSLAKIVFIPVGLTAVASAEDAIIYRRIIVSGTYC